MMVGQRTEAGMATGGRGAFRTETRTTRLERLHGGSGCLRSGRRSKRRSYWVAVLMGDGTLLSDTQAPLPSPSRLMNVYRVACQGRTASVRLSRMKSPRSVLMVRP